MLTKLWKLLTWFYHCIIVERFLLKNSSKKNTTISQKAESRNSHSSLELNKRRSFKSQGKMRRKRTIVVSCFGCQINNTLWLNTYLLKIKCTGILLLVRFFFPQQTTLIGSCFSIKIIIWDFRIFKVRFFAHFQYWNLTRFFWFWTEFSETKFKYNCNGSHPYCIAC